MAQVNEDELVLRTVTTRLRDYAVQDASEARAALVAKWREHHPEAAGETSSALKPLMKMEEWRKKDPVADPDEIWFNDTYNVTVRRFDTQKVFWSGGGMIQIGISAFDGTAKHDWRDFQAIKNQIAGPETEAFELYPAESRLLDPSNYYTLWCFPGMKRIKVGQELRRVWDADKALSPQRALPKEDDPWPK